MIMHYIFNHRTPQLARPPQNSLPPPQGLPLRDQNPTWRGEAPVPVAVCHVATDGGWASRTDVRIVMG